VLLLQTLHITTWGKTGEKTKRRRKPKKGPVKRKTNRRRPSELAQVTMKAQWTEWRAFSLGPVRVPTQGMWSSFISCALAG